METGRLEVEPFCWANNEVVEPEKVGDCARLFWIRTGCGRLTWERQSGSLRPYSLMCIGADSARLDVGERICGYRLEVKSNVIASSFPKPVFPTLKVFFDHLKHAVLRIHFGQRARCEAEWLLHRMMRDDSDSPELVWTSVRLMLAQFLLLSYEQWLLNEREKESVSAGAECVVRTLRTYIDSHLNEDFGLNRLSERAGYAPSYFSSLFSKVNGQGLTEYISRKRIGRAQELLRVSNVKIVEICYRVGFKDLAHFNRTFKRFVGVTPNQYRQSGTEALQISDKPTYARSSALPPRLRVTGEAPTIMSAECVASFR